jgi:hypothetical protein
MKPGAGEADDGRIGIGIGFVRRGVRKPMLHIRAQPRAFEKDMAAHSREYAKLVRPVTSVCLRSWRGPAGGTRVGGRQPEMMQPPPTSRNERGRQLRRPTGDKMTDVPFKVGDRVKKRSGYEYPGFIVSVFTNRAGAVRYVVEADHPAFSGMLHIFNGDQLEHR